MNENWLSTKLPCFLQVWFKNRRAKARAVAAQESPTKKPQTEVNNKNLSSTAMLIKAEERGSPEGKLTAEPSDSPSPHMGSPTAPVVKAENRPLGLSGQNGYAPMGPTQASPTTHVWSAAPNAHMTSTPPQSHNSAMANGYSAPRGSFVPSNNNPTGAYIPNYGPMGGSHPPPSYYALNSGMEYFNGQMNGMSSMISPSGFPPATGYPRAATEYLFDSYNYNKFM